MANPRGRRHRLKTSRPKRGRKARVRPPKKARRPKKAARAAGSEKVQAPAGCEAVKHYGDAWDYEHYEKENLKAQGLYL